MKTIILKVEVPDDAEMFSVSWRRPAEPEGTYYYDGYIYTRERNPTIIQLPTDKEIYAIAERHYPKADIYFSGNARDISRVAFIAGTNKIIEYITE